VYIDGKETVTQYTEQWSRAETDLAAGPSNSWIFVVFKCLASWLCVLLCWIQFILGSPGPNAPSQKQAQSRAPTTRIVNRQRTVWPSAVPLEEPRPHPRPFFESVTNIVNYFNLLVGPPFKIGVRVLSHKGQTLKEDISTYFPRLNFIVSFSSLLVKTGRQYAFILIFFLFGRNRLRDCQIELNELIKAKCACCNLGRIGGYNKVSIPEAKWQEIKRVRATNWGLYWLYKFRPKDFLLIEYFHFKFQRKGVFSKRRIYGHK